MNQTSIDMSAIPTLQMAQALGQEGMERWLPIPGYEGYYEVSDAGRVRSVDRFVAHARAGKQFVRGRIMSAGLDTKGYPRLVLIVNKRFKSWAVHRAVMAAFVPRADWETMHVNHKDGVRHNNLLSNLEWCTASENMLHSFRVLGRKPSGTGRVRELHHNSKPVIGLSIQTGEVRRYPSASSVIDHGFKPSDVTACARGDQLSHRGWMWFWPEKFSGTATYQPRVNTGTNNPSAKAVVRVGVDGDMAVYECAALAVKDGFTKVGISHCITGRQSSHRGYQWRLA